MVVTVLTAAIAAVSSGLGLEFLHFGEEGADFGVGWFTDLQGFMEAGHADAAFPGD